MDKEKEITTTYGITHPVNCPNNCGKLKVGHTGGVDFGDVNVDVYLVYCPKCKYEDSVQTG